LAACAPGGIVARAARNLITASTILPALIYGSTVILYLAVRKRLERKEGAFDLGRFELPVAIGALVWSIVVLFVLVTPSAAIVPVVIVVGLLAVGGLYFLYLLLFRREVLETEPDAASLGTGH
jgi:amino acid transporter